jgi:hypothetical protein
MFELETRVPGFNVLLLSITKFTGSKDGGQSNIGQSTSSFVSSIFAPSSSNLRRVLISSACKLLSSQRMYLSVMLRSDGRDDSYIWPTKALSHRTLSHCHYKQSCLAVLALPSHFAIYLMNDHKNVFIV